MVQTGTIVLAITAILSGLFRAYIRPTIESAGFFRTVTNLNNQRCRNVTGLEACEDLWIDEQSGLVYLACSQPSSRSNWVPAMKVLNADQIATPTEDYVAVLNLTSFEYFKLNLVGLPQHLIEHGLHVHGLDLFVGSEGEATDTIGGKDSQDQIRLSSEPSSDVQLGRSATIYLINHNRPKDLKSSQSTGADSVIEVFDTTLGGSKATYRQTIRHDLILTPNNLIGMNHHSFYVTNDHSSKVHWKRMLEPFVTDKVSNCVIYCSFESELSCMVAHEGNYPFPNGLAKGPGDSIYLANTVDPHLRVLEMQADYSLVLTDELKIPRMIDNIYVRPTGSIFLATIPNLSKFVKMMNDPHRSSSPTEIWKVSNGTGEDAFYGGRLQIEKIFGDDGHQVSGTTAVGVWKSKLVITGLSSPTVSVCEIDEDSGLLR